MAENTADSPGLAALTALAARYDPIGFGAALVRAGASLAGQPAPVARAAVDYCVRSGQAGLTSMLRAAGLVPAEPAVAGDRRHGDPAYRDNSWFALCLRQHQLFAEQLRALSSAAVLDPTTRRKVDFAVEQVIAAAAPANFVVSNPSVLRRAFDTGGQSLVRGMANMVRDLATNDGQPRQVPSDGLRVGTELATSPGKVVYRNRLIELIQYAPATDTVHETPMLFSPPWINKYYVMDLAPGRSLVEWAVRHGHTCFAISYRNPDQSMRDLGMADYLREGPLAALEVIREITGSPSANVVALCLGGTLATATSAWLAARGEPGVNSLTLMNTLLDFTEPGPLGVFTDAAAVANLATVMDDDGYLPAQTMKATFDVLRPAELVWNYVVDGWLMGAEPASFDMLAWNADSTRMPATMHTEYLTACYVENRLALGKMELAGERLDLGDIEHDSYVITAEADHIAPWTGVYASARLLGGAVRFVLSNSGHIAGVVNPPSPKSRHWFADLPTLPEEPAQWRADAVERRTSWWEDWTPWIAAHAGARVALPGVGSATYPPLSDAPGEYVFG
ncbi:PHA/PHB synthase family protein [Pseudonocardia spinosispora]|uniref:PHA/PHB synthase family protein n=1 Tax=Pseudonocardia spinosispora TaxID=103441 RepID=UPI001FDFA115|nr:alpha/beta fold hydrolase [Pseudonocardia spinosispora]